MKTLARAGRPLRFTDLERATAVPKGTLHALLASLLDSGFVERTPSGFRLGIVAFEVGATVPAVTSPREAASDALDQLNRQVGETCHFGTLVDGDVLYLDRRDSRHNLRFVAHVGERKFAYGTALGKAMLCLLTDEELVGLYPKRLPTLTSNTLRTRDDLVRDLKTWRQKGYALESEESTAGVTCIGMAIQVSGKLYGLSITAPVQRLSRSEIEALQPHLGDAASRIQETLAASSWLRVESA